MLDWWYMSMKPKKIKITPKNKQVPSSNQQSPHAETSDQDRGTGKSRLVIKPKGEQYHKLKEQHQSISDSYQKFRRNALILGGILLTALLIVSGAWMIGGGNREKKEEKDLSHVPSKYGYDLNQFGIRKDIVQKGQNIDDILISYGVPTAQIPQIRNLAQKVLDVDHLEEKSMLTVLTSSEDNHTEAIIYEPNPYVYTVFHVRDSIRVYGVQRKKETRLTTASGIIDSALWKTILDEDLHYDLIAKMEEALQWSVDFYHLTPGDRFKLVFEDKYADGEQVEVGELKAVYFQTQTKAFEAYAFSDGTSRKYYDGQARPMERSFLQSPVKYARISSAFNLNRYHPVLKKVKPHLGTDYAAPQGTPILAVADGVITIASKGKNNGNYVKIRHDQTYETQYLHMSKFAPGITKGVKVKQGDVIGFVGSTGLASGPHVCFRFWKNKQQIDHRAEELPAPKPLPDYVARDFFQLKDSLEQKLAAIGYN